MSTSPMAAGATVAVVAGTVALLTGSPPAALVAGLASVGTAIAAWRSTQDAEQVTVIELPAVAPGEAAPPVATPAVVARAAEVVDDDGLMSEVFLAETLRGRLAVARRALRPLAVVCFEVLELGPDGRKQPVAASHVADVLGDTLREADVMGRAPDGGFVFVLEDTGEDGAVWATERLRRNLAVDDPGRRFRAGVACYPNHGLDPDELRARARSALEVAREWTTDRIEVAPTS